MTTRDTLTIIGGIFLTIGPVMQTNAPTPTLFWVAQVMSALGGALITAGRFSSTPPKP